METSIAVLGTGAIGSSIGADLTRAGHDVLLIDQWPAHVDAMKTAGLRVILPEKELLTPVRAIHLCELCTVRPQLDMVFLAPKSYDSCWMVELIKPYLKPDGMVISAQNSLNEEWVAPLIGAERVIGCTLELSGELFEPGRVKRNTNHATTKFVLGELDGRITPRLQEIAQILSSVGKTGVTTNIWGAKWTKLVAVSMVFGLDVILWLRPWQILEALECLPLSLKLAKEAVQVASASGRVLDPVFGLNSEDFLKSTDEAFKKLQTNIHRDIGKEARTVMMQDIEKGRPTEIDYLGGLVVKKGREVKVATPLNEVVTSLVKQIEQGILKPGLSNLKMLEGYGKC